MNVSVTVSFGDTQFERLRKWMAREHFTGKADSFVRSKFMAQLDEHIPETKKEN